VVLQEAKFLIWGQGQTIEDKTNILFLRSGPEVEAEAKKLQPASGTFWPWGLNVSYHNSYTNGQNSYYPATGTFFSQKFTQYKKTRFKPCAFAFKRAWTVLASDKMLQNIGQYMWTAAYDHYYCLLQHLHKISVIDVAIFSECRNKTKLWWEIMQVIHCQKLHHYIYNSRSRVTVKLVKPVKLEDKWHISNFVFTFHTSIIRLQKPRKRSLFHCNILIYLWLSVLWGCWLGGRKGILPVKNWVVGCWRGYLSGARCRLKNSPADATATHCLLLQ